MNGTPGSVRLRRISPARAVTVGVPRASMGLFKHLHLNAFQEVQ
jgi:hypothetical protein